MDIRNGKCFDCGAEYKIPASFPHDIARCKECGKAVHVAKVGEPMPIPPPKAVPPAPAKKVAPKSTPKIEEYVPSGKKGEGPSMLERLRAERAAAAGGAAAGGAAAAAGRRPASKPGAARPARAAAGSQPAARRSTGARTSGAGTKRRSSRDAGDSKKRSERDPRKKPEKKTPVLGIVAIVVLVVGGATAFLLKDKLFGSSDAVEASGTEVVAENDGTTSEVDDADVSSTTDAGAEAVDTAAPEDASAEASTGPAETAETDPTPAADEGSEPDANAPVDEGPDTTLLADIGPILGATAEEMAAMDELMTTWMDPWAGRAGTKARDQLVNDYSYKALPSMINAMKMLDLSTEEGHRNGDLVQKTFSDMFFGTNFDWWYPDQQPDKYVTFNRKVVKAWHGQIEKIAESGIEYVIKMSKLEKTVSPDSNEFADPDRAKIAAKLRAQFGGGAAADKDDSDEDDLDLDVD